VLWILLVTTGCQQTSACVESTPSARLREALELIADRQTYAEGRRSLRSLGNRADRELRLLGSPSRPNPVRAWRGLVAVGNNAAFEALLDIRRECRDEWHRYAATRIVECFLRENDWGPNEIADVPGAKKEIVSWIRAGDGPADTLIRLVSRLRYRQAVPLLREYAERGENPRVRRLASDVLRQLEQPEAP